MNLDSELAVSNKSTIHLITILNGFVIYCWLFWLLYPTHTSTLMHWLSIGLLAGATLIASFARSKYYSIAVASLIWGGIAAVSCAAIAFNTEAALFLFILPTVVTHQLVYNNEHRITVVASVLLLAGIITLYSRISISSLFVLYLVVIYQTVLPLHLNDTLLTIWSAFTSVYQDQVHARDREAELRRVSKQLDEARTRVSHINKRLAAALDRAYEATRLKQEFAQNVSHELRTPLNLIVGFTSLMIDSPEHYGAELPFAYVRDLSIIHRNATHLQGLINDVLDMARIQAAQLSIKPTKSNPEQLIIQAVDTIRSLADAKSLEMNLQLEDHMPDMWLDQTRFRQIILNLLNNAIRFTDSGSINFTTKCLEDGIQFIIQDTGVGMSQEQVKTIFEAFHQSDIHQQRVTGLGLAISKQFIELHNGQIDVESTVNGGTTIRFFIPYKGFESSVSSISKPKETAPFSTRVTRSHTVIVVTQSHFTISLISQYLSDCQIHVVQDLEETLSVVGKTLPDAIIFDQGSIEVPPPEDLQTIFDTTNVLLMTLCFATPRSDQFAIGGYLYKPLEREALWNVMRRYGANIDKVLIIAEDEDFVRLFNRMLDHPIRRFHVIDAFSKTEGLEMLELHQPHFVFVDLDMSDRQGLDTIQRIRANADYADLPIVTLTSQDTIGDIESIEQPLYLIPPANLPASNILTWMGQIISAL
ncbi:response regulator [Phototrophicus methaneseepsis]|uniref:histidine kinase n=1 Tax=Phototrophicus methaneseepsis TaxID=2710758 RepID=A0A7S8IGR2_9CHLR|nr:ATP-binding protein [Phototrophicus methaneseepsis]QPC84972.1 response regulator [Phototrophicus methaneseepsis]